MYQNALQEKTGQRTVPNVFVQGKHIGGCDDTFKLHAQNKLIPMMQGEQSGDHLPVFDYDLIVLGGGSGGLAASKVRRKRLRKPYYVFMLPIIILL